MLRHTCEKSVIGRALKYAKNMLPQTWKPREVTQALPFVDCENSEPRHNPQMMKLLLAT